MVANSIIWPGQSFAKGEMVPVIWGTGYDWPPGTWKTHYREQTFKRQISETRHTRTRHQTFKDQAAWFKASYEAIRHQTPRLVNC